ncbi:hypothetical protein D3C71_234740 [compost metagenome]
MFKKILVLAGLSLSLAHGTPIVHTYTVDKVPTDSERYFANDGSKCFVVFTKAEILGRKPLAIGDKIVVIFAPTDEGELLAVIKN